MNRRTGLLLVIAVAIAALMVVMIKNRTAEPQVDSGIKVLVAATNISTGTFIRAGVNITWKDWPKGDVSPAFIIEQAHKMDEFNGGVARRDIIAGEPLTTASITRATEGGFMSAVLAPGKRAVSIAVNSTSGNAGFVFPGDHVDLILTHKVPDGVLASETFLENVRVLAIDQMLNNPDNKAVIAKTITLEVTPKQAEMINVASNLGSISVSLRSLGQDDAVTPEVPANSAKDNYATNNDVSKLMNDKGAYSSKVSVYHGSAAGEQLNFLQEGNK